MQSVKVSDSHPPDAWDQQAHSLLAPGVCDFVWSALLPLSSSPYLFMPSPDNPTPHPTPPTAPLFSKTDTGSEFKIDTQCECHFPAWLSLRQLFPAHSGQSESRSEPRLGYLVSSPHRQRRLESTVCCLSSLVSAVSLPPRPLPALASCGYGLFLSLFPQCRLGRSWLPALPPCVLSVAVVCHFPSLPVATLRARALSEARNTRETQTEFKCAPFFLSLNLSPFSASWALSVSPLLFFIFILYLSVCPCCLLSLCCPLLRRQARAHAISFAASVHMLTVKFKWNELKLSSILKSVGGTLRRTIQSHSEMGMDIISFRANKLHLIGWMGIMPSWENRLEISIRQTKEEYYIQRFLQEYLRYIKQYSGGHRLQKCLNV